MESFRPNHTLQLFDSMQSRASAVAAYITQAINAGANVLVIATPSTSSMLLEQLRAAALDAEGLIGRDCIRVLNAQQTVDALLRRDWPDPALADTTLTTVIAGFAQRAEPLWVYDEMADVLAERGLHRAARRLEELWNGLATRYEFELLCGYTSANFGDERTAEILKAIAGEHSRVRVQDQDMLGKFLLIRSGAERT